MSASLPFQALASTTDFRLSAEKSLGEVLNSLSELKPHSFVLPAEVSILKTCGNGAIAGLYDGKVVLVTVSPNSLSLLECDKPHTGVVWGLEVSQDYQLALSGALGGAVKLWSIAEKRELATLGQHGEDVYAVAMSLDGKLGISGGQNTLIKVWDLENRSERATLKGHNTKVSSVILTRDSEICISGDDLGVIKVWDLDAMKEIASFNGHTRTITCLVLSPDEKILWSGARDTNISNICVWSLENWQKIATLSGHTGCITSLKLIRDGTVCISASEDLKGKLWSLAEKGEVGTLEGHTQGIWGLAVLRNEKCGLTTSRDKTTKLWDLETCTEIVSFAGHEDAILNIALTADKQHFLTGSSDKTIKVWSLAEGLREERTLTFQKEIASMAVTEDCLALAIGKDIRLWSLKEDRELAVLEGHNERINEIIVTPDLQFLLSASKDCSVKLWDLQSRKQLHSFTDHTEEVMRLAVSPDGKFFLSAGWDPALKLWNLVDRSLVESINLGHRILRMVSPDGRNLASINSDGNISIWSLPDLKVQPTPSSYMDGATGIAITPDGKTLVSSGKDKTVRLWNFDGGRLLATLYGHSGSTNNVTISRDGQYAISSSRDETAIVWSLEERRQVACFSGHSGKMFTALFTVDSQYVITGSDDKTVRITPFVVPWESTDKSPLHQTSEVASIMQSLKEGSHLNYVAAKTLLFPYNVNSLHISAFYNYSERCREYLEMGVPFLKGAFGSPLTVSLKWKTLKCTDVLLKYLIDLAETVKKDDEWPIFKCINEDIPALLGCGSGLLHTFFSVLMQTPFIPPLPQFITPTSPLPIVQFSESRLLDIKTFDKSDKGGMGSELVNFLIGLIRWNTTPGSNQSLELLNALQDCEDKSVLTSAYTTLIIEQKWEYFYPITLSLTLLYAVMLASLVMLLFQAQTELPLAGVFICLNAFFMIYEIAQAVTSDNSYWLEPWNYLDLSRGLLCLCWGSLMFFEEEVSFLGADLQKDVRLVLALLCFLRGFTYFRSFRMTRLFVYLTLAVVKEMYCFLIVMGYSVFSFGVLISILLEHETLGVSWTSAFSLALGDFDSRGFGALEWCVFSCAAITNVIVMLNLLVSILGDAYEKTQMSARENDLFVMLGLVTEYEFLMRWRRTAGTPTIIHSCQRVQDPVATEEWAGLAVEMKYAVKEESENVKLEFEKKTTAMQEGLRKMQGGLKGLESRMKGEMQGGVKALESKMKEMQEKLDTLVDLLSQRS